MRLANSETHKLLNISHFSLLARLVRLARLALIFSREASLIFHKILARKIAKRDSPSTLPGRLSRRVGDQTVSPALKHCLLLYKLGNIVWGGHVACSKIFEYSLGTRKCWQETVRTIILDIDTTVQGACWRGWSATVSTSTPWPSPSWPRLEQLSTPFYSPGRILPPFPRNTIFVPEKTTS